MTITTTTKLVAGLIAAVIVCAIPASVLQVLGIVVGIATTIVFGLTMRGDIKLPGSVRQWLITLPSLIGASIALGVAAQLVQYVAAIAFWVIVAVFVGRGVSRLRKKVAEVAANEDNLPPIDNEAQLRQQFPQQ